MINDTFWNKFSSEITKQPKAKNLDYMIDLTFRNVDRLFVFSFKNGHNDPNINFLRIDWEIVFSWNYYMLLVENQDFDELIDNKPFSNQSAKNKQETY